MYTYKDMEEETELLVSLEESYENMIREIGEDPLREGLLKTPARAAKAFRYLTKGYQEDVDIVINGAVFESQINEMVVVKDIEFYSLCEHHLLPFFGKCHIGYLPDGKVLGLSKLARLVEMFARRLQIQEELTHQIAHSILESIDAKGVGVVIEASHLCMLMRGVEKQTASMKTSVMLDHFKTNPSTRLEFLELIKS
ncbi:MAG: GTP cyclohydrolase 1 [Chlamydiales bacterium]|nr:GTP cyclohydrolase 1 [Chlamydiales bacterium]MCH9622891.1 GTP cyclohydrolase 1 [Chlamydiales bacterium]